MANVIEILIQAKNQASAEIDKATGGLNKFATTAGLAAAAGGLAANVITQAMSRVQEVVVGNTLAMAGYAESLGRMSQDTGLSVTQLQVFRREIERNGLSAEQLTMSLRIFQEQLDSGKLAKLGVTSRDTFTGLQQLAGALRNAKDEAERVSIASSALGARNTALATSILDVAGAYGDHLNEAMSRGAIMTGSQKRAFDELDGSLDDFMDTMNAFKLASAEAFAPLIKGAVDALNAFNRLNQAFEGNKSRAMSRLMQGQPGWFGGGGAGDPSGAGRSWESNPAAGVGGGGGGKAAVDALGIKLDSLTRALTQVSGGPGSMLNARVGALADAYGGLGAASSSGKEISDPITKALTGIQEAAAQFGSNFEGSLRNTMSQALSITTASNNMIVMAFTSLANAVTQTIADMMAQAAAAGLVKLALSFLPGGGAISAGAKIATTFGATSMPAGGNTYVIQSISARDAMESILNPTGSIRRANDRVRDIGIAAMG